MAKIYNDITELVGKTPLVRIGNIEKELGLKAEVLIKLEYLNPAGSVKDRIAKAMIEDAEQKGILKEGSVIIAPFIPFEPSVSTISAPYALRILRLSTLMVSGMVRIIL